MKKIEVVTEKSFYTRVLAIMLPVAAQQAINMGVNMMDTMMLGSFGEVQLSASSLANAFYQIYQIFCMGITAGCSILMAQYWGAGRADESKQSFALGMRLTLLFGTLFTVVTAAAPEGIMKLYSDDPAVIEAGAGYLRITVWIFLIHGFGLVAAQLMRSVGQPKLGLYVSVISFAVNIFANWVFIFGNLGAPRMEIRGAALGTLIARISELVVTFVFILRIDKKLKLTIKDLLRRPSKEITDKYLKVGLPALCSDAMLGFGRTAVSMVIGRMGTVAAAANSMVQVVDRLFTVVIQGISNAASIVIGQSIGSGEKHKAQVQGKTLLYMAIAVSAVSCLLFMTVGPFTLRFYTIAEETARVTRQMMVTYSFLIIFQCIGSVMTKGVLRGGGDTRFLMAADVAFLWLISVPAGYVSGVVMGMPIYIACVFLRLDDILKSVMCVLRLNSGKWIHEVSRKQIDPDPDPSDEC